MPVLHAADGEPGRRGPRLAGSAGRQDRRLINHLTGALGIGRVSWLGDPSWALFAIVGISVWFLMGFYMIIFLGGLQDIPKEYYEAAKIDGAGPIASFFGSRFRSCSRRAFSWCWSPRSPRSADTRPSISSTS